MNKNIIKNNEVINLKVITNNQKIILIIIYATIIAISENNTFFIINLP